MTARLKVACRTETGPERRVNEDSFLFDADLQLLVVCDGMGGVCNGRPAAKVAMWTICEVLAKSSGEPSGHDLVRAMREAHQRIRRIEPLLPGVGVTATCLQLHAARDGLRLHVAQVGDTRLAKLTDAKLVALTREHTVKGELMATGQPIPSEKRELFARLVTRALGSIPECCEIDVDTFEIAVGDRFVLTTDGAHRHVSPAAIVAHCQHHRQDMALAVSGIVEDAIKAEADDNITACVFEVVNEGASTGVASMRPPNVPWLYAPQGPLQPVPAHWLAAGEPMARFQAFYAAVMGEAYRR